MAMKAFLIRVSLQNGAKMWCRVRIVQASFKVRL
jgi:hypothetical protein